MQNLYNNQKKPFKSLMVTCAELTTFGISSLKHIKIASIATNATLHVTNTNLLFVRLLMS